MHEDGLTKLLTRYPSYDDIKKGIILLLADGEHDAPKHIIKTQHGDISLEEPAKDHLSSCWKESVFYHLLTEEEWQVTLETATIGGLYNTLRNKLFSHIAIDFYQKAAISQTICLQKQYAVENFLINSPKEIFNIIARRLALPDSASAHATAEIIADYEISVSFIVTEESIKLIQLYANYYLSNTRYTARISQAPTNTRSVKAEILYQSTREDMELLAKIFKSPGTYVNVLHFIPILDEGVLTHAGETSPIPERLELINMRNVRNDFIWDIPNLIDALHWAKLTRHNSKMTTPTLLLLLYRWNVAKLVTDKLEKIESPKRILVLDTRDLSPFVALPVKIHQYMKEIEERGGCTIFYNEIHRSPPSRAIERYSNILAIIQESLGESCTQEWIKSNVLPAAMHYAAQPKNAKNKIEITLGMALYMLKTNKAPNAITTAVDTLSAITQKSIQEKLINPYFKQRYYMFLTKLITKCHELKSGIRPLQNKIWQIYFTYVPKSYYLLFPLAYYNPKELSDKDITQYLCDISATLSQHKHNVPIKKQVHFFPGRESAEYAQEALNVLRQDKPISVLPGSGANTQLQLLP